MEPQFNKFVTFRLAEEEQKVGETFNHLQTAVIQNRRADIAMTLLNLEVDPQNPDKFKQDHAFNKGQLAFADWILEISERNQAVQTETKSEPKGD